MWYSDLVGPTDATGCNPERMSFNGRPCPTRGICHERNAAGGNDFVLQEIVVTTY